MGLRDRLRGVLGRGAEPSGGAARPTVAEPSRPRLVPSPAAGPEAVPVVMEGAHVVDLRGPDGAAVLARLGALARELPSDRPVVVVDADEERAAGAAERLCALGVRAAWLRGAA